MSFGQRQGASTGSPRLSAFAVSLLLSSALVARGVANGAFDWAAPESSLELEFEQPGPSIHLLVLDAYPRQDTLALLGFDNAPFLQAMQDRGFDVYEDSHSNYDRTAFTLLTMLSMRHLTEIGDLWADVPDDVIEQTRVVSRALQDPPLFDALERGGYTTRVLQGPIVDVPLGGADLDDTVHTANNFELDLPQRSVISGVLEYFGFARGQQRAQVTETLAEFASLEPGPTFTLAHVLSPHAPYVFGPGGTVPDPPPCYPASCSIFESNVGKLGWSEAENWARFTDQVDQLNGLLLSTVDELVARDPNAVIVLFSDHGPRIPGNVEARFDNLLVARTPGFPRLLGSSPTNINILPRVFDAYLGTSIGDLPDALYTAGEEPWLAVERLRR